MNRKAVSGNILTSIPMLASVILISIIYIVLVFFAQSLIKPSAEKSVTLNIPTENLMFKSVEVEFSDGSKKEILVHDAFILMRNKEIHLDSFINSLEQLKKDGDCYYFSYFQTSTDLGALQNPQIELGEKHLNSKAYSSGNLLIPIRQYYGPCEVKNE